MQQPADNEELALGLEGRRSSLEEPVPVWCDEILVGNFHTAAAAAGKRQRTTAFGLAFKVSSVCVAKQWSKKTRGRPLKDEQFE